MTIIFILSLFGCASDGSSNDTGGSSNNMFATYGDIACLNKNIWLVRVSANVDKKWSGKVVRFQFNLPGNGKPEQVSVVSTNVPPNVAKRAQQAFEKSRLKPAVVDGKLMRQLNCEINYVLPNGA